MKQKIPPYCKNMTNIYLNLIILHYLKYNDFDIHADEFQDIFKLFIYVHVNNIGFPALFTEWMKILDKVAYHKNLNRGETIPSLKRKIDINADKRYQTSKVADEIKWFHFQYSLIHAL